MPEEIEEIMDESEYTSSYKIPEKWKDAMDKLLSRYKCHFPNRTNSAWVQLINYLERDGNKHWTLALFETGKGQLTNGIRDYEDAALMQCRIELSIGTRIDVHNGTPIYRTSTATDMREALQYIFINVTDPVINEEIPEQVAWYVDSSKR